MASPTRHASVADRDEDFVQFMLALRSLSEIQRQAVTDMFGLILDYGIEVYNQLCSGLPFLHAVLTRVDLPSGEGMTRADVMFGRALMRRRQILEDISRQRSQGSAVDTEASVGQTDESVGKAESESEDESVGESASEAEESVGEAEGSETQVQEGSQVQETATFLDQFL
ncbi:hypothetical protein VNI00_013153 [Paramarasmius palmivorus]|uniref:Uncharacterized protein n=1 Tax=Paramarasmius palmivorus TaxID=297713 RepID=A0AAW0C1A9_9AGAR